MAGHQTWQDRSSSSGYLNRNIPEPTTFVDGTQLKNVDNLIYLDVITSSDGSIGRENTSRISKASQALGRICTWMLNQHNTRLSTKLGVYSAAVLTSFLCGLEARTLYHLRIKQLEQFHMHALCSILGIHWQYKIINLEILDTADTDSTGSPILRSWIQLTLAVQDHQS